MPRNGQPRRHSPMRRRRDDAQLLQLVMRGTGWRAFIATIAGVCFVGCETGGGRTIIECGGLAKFKCPAGFYCELGPRCGGIDHRGECAWIPTDCPHEVKPVCGCNKKTFDSACLANAAGVTVDYEGPCMEKDR